MNRSMSPSQRETLAIETLAIEIVRIAESAADCNHLPSFEHPSNALENPTPHRTVREAGSFGCGRRLRRANMTETTLSFSKLRVRRVYMTENADKKISKNPEVIEKAARRRFTEEYKRRIAIEAEACTLPGEIGALLRREGLYSSVVQRWRRQLREEPLSSSKKSSSAASPAQPSAAKEIAVLKRENERLKERLRQAELIIDVQKKVSEMMQTQSPEKTD
jgi:transposase-like protein